MTGLQGFLVVNELQFSPEDGRQALEISGARNMLQEGKSPERRFSQRFSVILLVADVGLYTPSLAQFS